jgi:hypothetical protein
VPLHRKARGVGKAAVAAAQWQGALRTQDAVPRWHHAHRVPPAGFQRCRARRFCLRARRTGFAANTASKCKSSMCEHPAILIGMAEKRQKRSFIRHMLLVPVHAWFTEGFDTSDLAQARALTVELGAPSSENADALNKPWHVQMSSPVNGPFGSNHDLRSLHRWVSSLPCL